MTSAVASAVEADPRGRRVTRADRETPEQCEERRAREREARARRYWRRDQLREITSLARIRKCGHSAVSDGGVTVGVAANPDGTTHAGYGGIATCGSVWSCPQCAAVVATRRADELADVMRAVDLLSGSAFLLTLTMRHTTGDRLGWTRDQRRRHDALTACERRRQGPTGAEPARCYLARTWTGGTPTEDTTIRSQHTCDVAAERAELAALALDRGCWDAAADGWAAVTSGGTWVKDQERHGGLLGWCKVTEVTDGRNGWHVHIHALLCFGDDVTELDVAPMAARMFERWQRKLRDQGFDASGDMAADGKVPGWDLRRAQLGDGDLADYFTKLAHEVTSAHRKEGRRPGGRTPMLLLADALETYRAEDVARWWEWEAASDGRRQLTWSGGRRSLRALAGLHREQSDEEIADEEKHADERLGLAPETWGWVRSSGHVATVLAVAETTGLDGLIAWLDEHGQGYVRGAGIGWVERPPDAIPPGPVPRDEGIGRAWQMAPPAVLREHGSDGRARPRPSDRPPRWSDDARAVLAYTPNRRAGLASRDRS